MDKFSAHRPVLLEEMLEALSPQPGRLYIDATFGGGGYSRALLARADCRVVGVDRDPEAVVRGMALAERDRRFTMVAGRFGGLRQALPALPAGSVDGIVADIGVSSFQLDQAERGFSFQQNGPLDMRMSADGESAADLLNRIGEADLVQLLVAFGEEPEARRVAAAIIQRRLLRPFVETADLAATVAGAKRRHKPGRHPATQVFQALRMAVNNELAELEGLLEASLTLLGDGGRLVIVSFHSLEDRLVKRFVDKRGGSRPQPSRHLPLPDVDEPVELRWARRKAVKAGDLECRTNPRARSARLRVALRQRRIDERECDVRRAA